MREFFKKLKSTAYVLILVITAQQGYSQHEGVVKYTYYQDLGVPGYMEAALYFTKTASYYYQSKFEYPRGEVQVKPGSRIVKEFDSDANTKNLLLRCVNSLTNQKLVCVETPASSKPYYVEEKTPVIQWKITDSTKTLGSYKVQMATGYFRGRTYRVWFTPEIPISLGPWKLSGLPGLILEGQDQSGRIKFIFKGVQPNIDNEKLNIPMDKYPVVNIKDYQDIKKQALIEYDKKLMAQLGVRDAQLVESKEAPDEFKLEFDYEWEQKPKN